METEHGELLGHRQPKGPANKQGPPKPPRHSSTLLRPSRRAAYPTIWNRVWHWWPDGELDSPRCDRAAARITSKVPCYSDVAAESARNCSSVKCRSSAQKPKEHHPPKKHRNSRWTFKLKRNARGKERKGDIRYSLSQQEDSAPVLESLTRVRSRSGQFGLWISQGFSCPSSRGRWACYAGRQQLP